METEPEHFHWRDDDYGRFDIRPYCTECGERYEPEYLIQVFCDSGRMMLERLLPYVRDNAVNTARHAQAFRQRLSRKKAFASTHKIEDALILHNGFWIGFRERRTELCSGACHDAVKAKRREAYQKKKAKKEA